MARAPREVRIGTRGSQLALWQANTVAGRLAESGAPPTRIVVIRTTGDALQDRPLSEVGGKRLFVKEIEDALLRGEVDLAVHSSKDMPAVLPAGLAIAGVLPREDPHDAIVLPDGDDVSVRLQADAPASLDAVIARLGPSPSIGTGSIRRVSQLSRIFHGAHFAPIRGNLDTRLRKLDSGQHAALVLAAAGLRRLGFASRISLTLPATACVPAPGQGIVAIEVREDDTAVRDIVSAISDADAAVALDAERALVETLGGGCQTPIGALATILPGAADDGLELVAVVATRDGRRVIRASAHGFRNKAASLGARVGRDLIQQGADAILAEVRLS
ncbi:MAG TPA: hydroxymethylbilane synthase [Vicinamibacterales bacterium]|nr:hydroxymethylbilane synthase [Vicinamibacterales bacterium]